MKALLHFVGIVAAFGWALLVADSARGQDVRVRLLDLNEPVAVTLTAHGGTVALFAGAHEDPLVELADGGAARVSRASDQLHVEVGDMTLFAHSLRAEPDDGALFGIEIGDGAARQELRRYAGRLRVSIDGEDWEVQLVNEVPLEEYVASVVDSEYGFDDLEGSKAMAILVRTYALGVLGKYGAEYDHVDHTLSQVYLGADRVTPVSRNAAELTDGQVLTHEGELIRAVYFSSSGGHTADNESVWEGVALPYLRGRPDPYGGASPHNEWTARIARDELLSALRSAHGSSVEGFVIGDRSDDGRVALIHLLRTNGSRSAISGNAFRLLLADAFGTRSVRSTLFVARRVDDVYIFEGHGFGHGVGLSQWGAHDMALRGMNHAEILQFYYSDVEIRRESNAGDERIDIPARLVQTKPEPDPERPSRPGRRIGW